MHTEVPDEHQREQVRFSRKKLLHISIIGAMLIVAPMFLLQYPRIDHLSNEEAKIIRFILREIPRTIPGQKDYFLTSSSRENEWGNFSRWKSLTDQFHQELSEFPVTFRPAVEAKMVSQRIFDKKTGKPAWMRWVSIRSWESPTEVFVEEGLRGGTPCKEQGTILFLSRKDENWTIEAVADRWSDVLTEKGWEIE